MTPSEILLNTKVTIAPETFALIRLTPETWNNLLADPAHSPRMTAPFMIFKDQFEVTLIVDDTDLRTMRPGLTDAQIANGYRLITFDTVLELSVVGFMAEISRILTEASVPILPISAFSRDHLLIRQIDLAAALKALGPHIAELC